MNNLKTLVLSLGLTASFGLAGCGNSTLDEMEAMKNKVCECKDAECFAKLQNEGKDLKEKMKKLEGEDKEKAMKIAGELAACAMKIGS